MVADAARRRPAQRALPDDAVGAALAERSRVLPSAAVWTTRTQVSPSSRGANDDVDGALAAGFCAAPRSPSATPRRGWRRPRRASTSSGASTPRSVSASSRTAAAFGARGRLDVAAAGLVERPPGERLGAAQAHAARAAPAAARPRPDSRSTAAPGAAIVPGPRFRRRQRQRRPVLASASRDEQRRARPLDRRRAPARPARAPTPRRRSRGAPAARPLRPRCPPPRRRRT